MTEYSQHEMIHKLPHAEMVDRFAYLRDLCAGRRVIHVGFVDMGCAQLNTQSVRHVCLPWGVSGRQTADALARLGFSTAVANRMPGMFAARQGDHPFWLKRLPNRYIYCLPGDGRRWFFSSLR